MREAIRSSGEAGRKRVEENEARRQRKEELAHDAPAQGELPADAAPAEGEQGGQGGRVGESGVYDPSRIHRFQKFDDGESGEETPRAADRQNKC